jgi:hypothetical protein
VYDFVFFCISDMSYEAFSAIPSGGLVMECNSCILLHLGRNRIDRHGEYDLCRHLLLCLETNYAPYGNVPSQQFCGE